MVMPFLKSEVEIWAMAGRGDAPFVCGRADVGGSALASGRNVVGGQLAEPAWHGSLRRQHERRILRGQGEAVASVVGDHQGVLDADTPELGEVHAGLDRDDVAGDER